MPDTAPRPAPVSAPDPSPESAQAAGAASGPPSPMGGTGVVRARKPLLARLNAWRKRTLLNPYGIELRELLRSVEALVPHAEGVLLDVGVGEKPYAKLFEPRVDRYYGLEYPPVADNLHPEIWGMLERVRGIIDVWGDGGALPFADESFDCVMAVEVLEHVPDPTRLVRDFVRTLKPGGKVLLTLPFSFPQHQLPYDYYRFTPKGIRALVEREGLEVIELEPRGNYSTALGALCANWILRHLGAQTLLHDGSVRASRWRAPFLAPLYALVQLFFLTAGRFTKDATLTTGHWVIARKPAIDASE